MPDGKKNVLLSFVGNSDPWPYKGTPEERTAVCPDGFDEGAILGLCKGLDEENHPDILYMFPSCRERSQNNTEWRAEWVREILSREEPEIRCQILPLNIDDPTNFEQISREWDRNISLVLDELKGEGSLEDCQFQHPL